MRMSCFRSETNICLGCSDATIELSRYDTLKNANNYQDTKEGLVCSLCNRLLCSMCIHNVYSQIKTKLDNNGFHDDCLPFLQHIKAYVTDEAPPSKPYIGHCCIIDVQYKQDLEVQQQCHNQLHPRKQIKLTHTPLTGTNVGGCLCYSEFRLLTPISLDAMDVLALGAEGNGLKPRWHFTITEEQGAEFVLHGVFPRTTLPDSWKVIELVVNVRIPHSLSKNIKKQYRKMNVRVIYALKLVQENDQLRGSNHITDSDLTSSYYFDSTQFSKVDITLILGYDADAEYGSILLCRFHNLSPELKYGMSARDLLQDLQEHLKNDGLERRRLGGSSGYVTYSKEFKKLMKTSNSSPRCSKGVIWLRDSTNLKWNLYYIGTKDNEASCKYTYYTNPKPGGSFVMKPEMYLKYDFLLDYTATKALTASLAKAVEAAVKGRLDIKQLSICPIACNEELWQASATRDFLIHFLQHSTVSYTEFQKKQLYYQFYAANFVTFTLVMHPVGRHLDVFADGKPSLENRVCFAFNLDKYGQTNVSKTGNGYGRGGCRMGMFCFALLDWQTNQRFRRQCWTDPRNAELPNSASQIARERGHTHERLRPALWNAFMRNGSSIHLPPGVNRLDDL